MNIQLKKFKKLKNFLLNFGPQHPAAHGVLRLILELDGEIIKRADPHIGLLHRGTEKLLEYKTFYQGLPYFDRLDYVSMMAQELTFSLIIEILSGLTSNITSRSQFIRVIFLEITRILNHLLALTTHALDVGAMTPFLWAFERREKLMELYERISGARLHANYIRFLNGSFNDFNLIYCEFENFNLNLQTDLITILLDIQKNITQTEYILNTNRIWKQRLIDIGIVEKNQALSLGFSGVLLRGSGIPWDLRKDYCFNPIYSNAKENFKIPLGKKGDCFDRFLLRLQEIKYSISLIIFCLDNLPNVLLKQINNKFDNDFFSKSSLPHRLYIKEIMESLIQHFKIFTESFLILNKSLYFAIEAPKGEFGVFLVTNSFSKPYRCRIRTPGFFHLQGLDYMSKNHMIADLVTIIGTQDIVFGEIDR